MVTENDPYNASDPLFLASRTLDETLSSEDHAVIDHEAAASSEFRADMDALKQTDQVLKDWCSGSVEIDWNAHRQLIVDRIAGEQDEAALAKVDQMLDRWWPSQPMPCVDEERFQASVMAKITEQKNAGQTWRRIIVRIGVPLAAAAAIALAVTAQLWMRPAAARSVVVIGQPSFERDFGKPYEPGERLAVVRFRRTPVSPIPEDGGRPAIGIGTLGVSMPLGEVETAPPL